MMYWGRSFSGHERNCAFLNMHNGRFATASAITGFDFEDDTRALATTDWDHDGDLDVWTTNRTSPRLRFLRNHLPRTNNYVCLLLKGSTCTRDAIGSRVKLHSTTLPDRPLIRTCRAGDGFLSESSRWIHFGIGTAKIEKLEVLWPDGTKQSFAALKENKHYVICQGEPTPREIIKSAKAKLKPFAVNDEKLQPNFVPGRIGCPIGFPFLR